MSKILETWEALLRYRADAETFSRLSREYAARADRSRQNVDAMMGSFKEQLMAEVENREGYAAVEEIRQSYEDIARREAMRNFNTFTDSEGKSYSILKPADFGELKTSEEGYRELRERKDVAGVSVVNMGIYNSETNNFAEVRYFSENNKHIWGIRNGKSGVRCMKCFRHDVEPNQNEPCEAGDAPVNPILNVGVDPLEPIPIIIGIRPGDKWDCIHCHKRIDTSDIGARSYDHVFALCGSCEMVCDRSEDIRGIPCAAGPDCKTCKYSNNRDALTKTADAFFQEECDNNDACACHAPKTGHDFAEWMKDKPTELFNHLIKFGVRNNLPSGFQYWPDDAVALAYFEALSWIEDHEPATEPA